MLFVIIDKSQISIGRSAYKIICEIAYVDKSLKLLDLVFFGFCEMTKKRTLSLICRFEICENF